MAGLGKKTFTAGEVLRAADVNGYLMDQSVQVYAGTAARGSAIGTAVSEGMVSYLADTDFIEVYTPAGWANVSSVLQVVSGTFSGAADNATTTFVDSGISLSITPKYSNSKILVLMSTNGYKSVGNAGSSLRFQLVRGATAVVSQFGGLFYTGTSLTNFGYVALNYLDSPGTTSATTYKIQFSNAVAATSAGLMGSIGFGYGTAQMTLIEVKG